MIKTLVPSEPVIHIDDSNVVKPNGYKFESLGIVRDGSESTSTKNVYKKGYHVTEACALTTSNHPVSIFFRIHSFQFENFRVRKLCAIIKTANPVKKKVFFCYYRLAKGISGILSYAKEGVRLWFRTKRPTYRQYMEENREPLSAIAIEKKLQLLRNKHFSEDTIALVKSDYEYGLKEEYLHIKLHIL